MNPLVRARRLDMDDHGRHTIRLTNKGVRFLEATIDVALDGMLPRRKAQEVRRACRSSTNPSLSTPRTQLQHEGSESTRARRKMGEGRGSIDGAGDLGGEGKKPPVSPQRSSAPFLVHRST